jgi:hypothetical protein
MSRNQWLENLEGLCQSLQDYAAQNSIAFPNPSSHATTRLSNALYLAHSTADKNFSDICASGYLASAARLAADRGGSLPSKCIEVLMGTSDCVFFYIAAFCYPQTGCGFLFAKSLESQHRDTGVATPFDSGGLIKRYALPVPAEPPTQFMSRYELPIPEHRRYLGLCMDILFNKPEDYVEGLDPRWPGPIGLTPGDHRRFTHEVRIPDRVLIRGSHLQAVFAPRARVTSDPEIESLFQWCDGEGVDNFFFDTPRRNDFEELRRICLAYIRRKLY